MKKTKESLSFEIGQRYECNKKSLEKPEDISHGAFQYHY
jgi:hypothetical protein